jgi:hypothetical protein
MLFEFPWNHCLSCWRLVYSNELTVGAQVLRPFHLAWRADFGLSAIIEPETLVELAELILLHGFPGDSLK